jgi:pimeloyl-ACP methyl ester carboxylesterase
LDIYTRGIESRYGEIDAATLVLWGAEDGWLDPRFGEQLANSIPGALLSLIPDAGHFVQLPRLPHGGPIIVAGSP